MKKIFVLGLIALALSGCDNSPEHKFITCSDNNNNSVIVDVVAFPEYVTVNGKRLYPDESMPIYGVGNIDVHNFIKEKTGKGDDLSYNKIEMDLQKPRSMIKAVYERVMRGQFQDAYNVYASGFTFGSYQNYTAYGLQAQENNMITGSCSEGY
ncbi:TPA: hypothetical protein OUD88_002878 [Enterobacter hormaechei]|nr:hypothetical protein [Enterobacter hormaechei]